MARQGGCQQGMGKHSKRGERDTGTGRRGKCRKHGDIISTLIRNVSGLGNFVLKIPPADGKN